MTFFQMVCESNIWSGLAGQGHSKIAAIYETVPVLMPPTAECGSPLCLNTECKRCWGFLDDLDDIFEPSPGVAVDLDDMTHDALRDVARQQGTTVSAVAQAVLRRWAAGRKGREARPRR
ncbi:hypothetical protein N826_36595 [Skermanella aerolata KACC 11604]|nr:hypothetical protein N826_36595 [Skermanella aerolata KACC 11604]